MKRTQRATTGWKHVGLLLAALVIAGGLRADEAATAKSETATQEEETAKLAKETQNPVASLISVPFQNNFNFDVGPRHVTQWIMNVQPVIPISLNDDWNLITRTIVPIINQPSVTNHVRSAFGLGDINPTLFLSPAKPSKFIWGVGPTWTMPTATDSMLGANKWDAGPSVGGAHHARTVGHRRTGEQPVVVCRLRPSQINAMLVQPFINYNLDKGWYLTTAPIITANWNADDSDVWTVPLKTTSPSSDLVESNRRPTGLRPGCVTRVSDP